MSKKTTIDSLGALVRLRSTEVERLETELAKQQATRARYQASVERLVALAEGSGASGQPAGQPADRAAGLHAGGNAPALSPALAVNCGNYKQAVFALADNHRTDLHLHEANMAVSQQNLAQAWTRRELLDKVLARHEAALAQDQERAQRKREDEVSTQSWLAGRTE